MPDFIFGLVIGNIIGGIVGIIIGNGACDSAWRKWCIKVCLARHNPTTGDFEVIPERFPAEAHKAAKEAAE